MGNVPLMRKWVYLFFMLGCLLLILQGCQTPLVKVDTVVDGCCKEGDCSETRGTVSGCGTPLPVTTPGTHDGLQCNSGEFCNTEGAICSRAPGGGWMFCDTQIQPGTTNVCFCNCTATPDWQPKMVFVDLTEMPIFLMIMWSALENFRGDDKWVEFFKEVTVKWPENAKDQGWPNAS